MRMLLIVVGVLVALGAAVVIAGYLLPVKHGATVAATIPASPEVVWGALTTPAEYPAWRRDVASVELLPGDSGRVAWRESGKDGAISFVVEHAEAPHRLVTRITDKSLPFGGSWEYLVTAEGAGSRVQITEHGEVYNPVFRFVSRFIMGHSATASAYLKALGRRYGAEVVPVVG
ncbi:MAG: SRPBCC family protein [Gemmatimonadaceae bacterium]